MRKIVKLTTLVTLGVGVALGGVACGKTETRRVYEDCEVSDQNAQEDDCGYWTRAGTNRSGARPAADWTWVWFDWVDVGRDSSPDAGWVPPAGTNPPYEDVEVKKTKKTPAPGTSTAKKKKPATTTQDQGRTEKSVTGNTAPRPAKRR